MATAQTSLLEAFAELIDPCGWECEHKREELLLAAVFTTSVSHLSYREKPVRKHR
jgi:hypothetical protein